MKKEKKIKFLKVFFIVLICVFLVAFSMPSADVKTQQFKNLNFNEESGSSIVFESKEELDNYLDSYRTMNNENVMEMIASLEKYDDEYFEENILVQMMVVANSIEAEYVVSNVDVENEVLTVCLSSRAPERVSLLMTRWSIFLEYHKTEINNVVIIQDGMNITN